jgi:aryl-alcohol dehydrogenase-like predicted oxidoreductase
MLGVQVLKIKAVNITCAGFPSVVLREKSYTNALEKQLEAIQELVKAGKVRYAGLSNETPYGLCAMVNLAKQFPDLYPKIVSIQNSYSMVMRKDFKAGLAESYYLNDVRLVSYSNLAGGSLIGKYRDKNNIPKGSRLTSFLVLWNASLAARTRLPSTRIVSWPQNQV